MHLDPRYPVSSSKEGGGSSRMGRLSESEGAGDGFTIGRGGRAPKSPKALPLGSDWLTFVEQLAAKPPPLPPTTCGAPPTAVLLSSVQADAFEGPDLSECALSSAASMAGRRLVSLSWCALLKSGRVKRSVKVIHRFRCPHSSVGRYVTVDTDIHDGVWRLSASAVW